MCVQLRRFVLFCRRPLSASEIQSSDNQSSQPMFAACYPSNFSTRARTRFDGLSFAQMLAGPILRAAGAGAVILHTCENRPWPALIRNRLWRVSRLGKAATRLTLARY